MHKSLAPKRETNVSCLIINRNAAVKFFLFPMNNNAGESNILFDTFYEVSASQKNFITIHRAWLIASKIRQTRQWSRLLFYFRLQCPSRKLQFCMIYAAIWIPLWLQIPRSYETKTGRLNCWKYFTMRACDCLSGELTLENWEWWNWKTELKISVEQQRENSFVS